MLCVNRVLLILSVIILISCSRESDPEPEPVPEPLLTIDSKMYSPFQGEQSWFFLLDESGAILETQQYKGFETLKFKATTSDKKISLAWFNHLDGRARMVIYGGIEPHSTIVLAVADAALGPAPSVTGSASVTVTNLPPIQNNFLTVSAAEISYSSIVEDGLAVVLCPILGEKTPLLLSAFDAEGMPVYTWTAEAKAGDEITANFTDFAAFPNTISVPVNGRTEFQLAGYNHDWEYYGTVFTSGDWYENAETLPVMGYLPGYKGYYTRVQSSSHTDGQTSGVLYEKRGTIPTTEQMELPQFTHSVIDSSAQHSGFMLDRDFDYTSGLWSYDVADATPFSLEVYAPKGLRPRINGLPPVILEKWPSLDLEKLELGYFKFMEHIDDYTYEQAITDIFSYHFHIETYERRSYYVFVE
jgi:hypothetical protein